MIKSPIPKVSNKKQLKISNIVTKYMICFLLAPNFFLIHQAFSEESYKLNEMEINRTINLDDEDNLGFPTNPFEIVDRLRRTNSMKDATKPSEAIDDAIKSFDMINEDK